MMFIDMLVCVIKTYISLNITIISVELAVVRELGISCRDPDVILDHRSSHRYGNCHKEKILSRCQGI